MIGPMVEERWKGLKEYGTEWADKPVRIPFLPTTRHKTQFTLQDDFLMWLMEDAPPGDLQSTESLATYLIFLNFAAIHTTSMVGPLFSSKKDRLY